MLDKRKQRIRIAITGPESTGKTTLAKQLSEHYHGILIEEFAREYVEGLQSKYTYEDIESIARRQVAQYLETENSPNGFYFFDTWLIITKVWFNWVFGRTPAFLDNQIQLCPIDLFLLCQPDLPWEADSVRENGGETRIRLYDEYKKELNQYGFKYVEISGIGEVRMQSAVIAINGICIEN